VKKVLHSAAQSEPPLATPDPQRPVCLNSMPVGLGQLEHGTSRRRVVHEARGSRSLVMFSDFVFNWQYELS